MRFVHLAGEHQPQTGPFCTAREEANFIQTVQVFGAPDELNRAPSQFVVRRAVR